MWVWIAIAVGLLVALIIFSVAALRAWRQIKALRTHLTAVRTDLESYTERLQVAAPGERRG
jgi:uncharacterized membrane-anchored protein YhcB (DUF1043 family)